jgi:CRP-like cAMP-binding protein
MLPAPAGRSTNVERVMATHTDHKLELLRQSPFLADLGRKDLEEVGRLADEIDVPAGRVLIREGDIGREFFVIIDGAVDISRGDRIVATMGPGDFFGDIALVTERPRTASATATAPTTLLVLGHREFHTLMDQFPSIRLGVLQSVANRLRALEPDPVN